MMMTGSFACAAPPPIAAAASAMAPAVMNLRIFASLFCTIFLPAFGN
jgi:hypothetical protein